LSGPFWTYGKESEFVDPGPSSTFVLLDEDPDSLNDAGFGVGATKAEWIDWPGTSHNMANGFSFEDGHSEIHKWKDSRTQVKNHNVSRLSVPGSVDWQWVATHATARKDGKGINQ
jgi:hypothetical protein